MIAEASPDRFYVRGGRGVEFINIILSNLNDECVYTRKYIYIYMYKED